jgi:hypothetical protein
MKLPLIYGLGLSIAGAVLTLILFFLGYHSDLDKFETGQTTTSILGVVITVIVLILGLRAIREATPDGSLSYGRAVGNGALITLFSGIFSAIFVLIYGLGINPEFHELVRQLQELKMEEQGMDSQQIEAASGMMSFFTGPVFMAMMTLLFSPMMGTVISLILGIFLKRAPVTTPPPVPVV